MNDKDAGLVGFEVLIEQTLSKPLSRRRFLKNVAMFGVSGFVSSVALAGRSTNAINNSGLNFSPVKTNTLDTITLPDGFSWYKLISWGDPMWSSGKQFNPKTRGDSKSQALAFGDYNDGMAIFSHRNHTILIVNNESTNNDIIYGNRVSRSPESADDVLKNKLAHGVSVLEIKQKQQYWQVVKDSIYNRKITANSVMDITGPARGHRLLRTQADPSGTTSLGTWNNCGSGRTPWGTYLTCEENFNQYFSSSDKDFLVPHVMKRYGIKTEDEGYAWAKYDQRFDISKHPNEVNRVGYIVEFDPSNPNSMPKKHTALGRFKHENVEMLVSEDGRVVAYMADDERGEYLYKFVSKHKYQPHGDNTLLLEKGDLYAAKFFKSGMGRWLLLSPKTTKMSKAEICIYTRMAASAVGATTMDSPEWVVSHPFKAEVYCALTHNKNRGIKPNKGGDATPVDAVNPRKNNRYGQIVRWIPKNGKHSSDRFEWNLFVLAGNPRVHQGLNGGSSNITVDNMFNSPDSLGFDSKGRLWIQTDGTYSNEGDFLDMGNNQMLLGDTQTGEIKRFMVGPNACEITGLCWSVDKRTMFVGIQHPGEKGIKSHFPDGKASIPRSTVIAIYRDDGGVIG